MALSVSQTLALAPLLKPGMAVASMGYPDMIAVVEDLPGLQYRADSEAICKRHGLPMRQIPDAESYFSLKGCKLDVYDVVRERGCEILCDLNEVGMGISYTRGGIYACYDIVLDVGTLEHCFNIGQAMISMANLVKAGGYIIHENPFNWGNHGFYNLNPTLFADFYSENGFKLIECVLVGRDGYKVFIPPTQRFVFTKQEMNVFTIAQRVEVKPFVMPCQSKYKNLITAAGSSGERAANARAIGA